ncbi:MAG: GNAT family N-acetyltransferase [Pseudomonadota bacterium]
MSSTDHIKVRNFSTELIPASKMSSNEQDDILHIFHADHKYESSAQRSSFEERWMTPYLKQSHCTTHFALAKSESKQVIGYLLFVTESQRLLPAFEGKVRAYKVFQDLYEDFPAHLHINLSPACRGLGIGSTLVSLMIKQLQAWGCKGIHLVTTPDARNVSFYRKNEFGFEEERRLDDTPLLFLGRKLQPTDS